MADELDQLLERIAEVIKRDRITQEVLQWLRENNYESLAKIETAPKFLLEERE